MFAFGKGSLNALRGISPKLVAVMTKAIATSPVDFSITDGVRTQAQQYALWLKGRDPKTGKIVDRSKVVTMRNGTRSKSNHQPRDNGFGYAVDIYPYIAGSGIDFNDKYGRMDAIAAHIKSIAAEMGVKIVWGGDWTVEEDGIVDRPHFELK